MAHIAKGATDKGNHILFFSHRKEINEQVKQTFSINNVNMDLVSIGSVQSLVKKMDSLQTPDIILVDEAHHIKAKSYQKILDYFPNALKLFFTGTPIRLDGSGFDDLADDLILGKSIKWLQEHGNIAPFKYYAPNLIDESILKKKAGEFTTKSVDESMKQVVYGDVIQHYEKLSKDKQAIVYAHSVESAERVSDEFNLSGYNSAVVHGKTPKTLREDTMHAFKSGDIKILVNVELFTEGIDLPDVTTCIMLRPTQSLSLFLQFAMRPLNPRPNKTAILIDHVGNCERHGLPNDDREWTLKSVQNKSKKKSNEPDGPIPRTCEECFGVYFGDNRICPLCGHENKPTPKEIEYLKEVELQEITETKKKILTNKVSTYVTADMCESMEELKEFGKQRGYKPGWAYYMAKNIGLLY